MDAIQSNSVAFSRSKWFRVLPLETRQRLLDAVARYEGNRIRKAGTRFPLYDGIVWQLVDEAGVLHGQAATFPI